jgi:hypothetical protein
MRDALDAPHERCEREREGDAEQEHGDEMRDRPEHVDDRSRRREDDEDRGRADEHVRRPPREQRRPPGPRRVEISRQLGNEVGEVAVRRRLALSGSLRHASAPCTAGASGTSRTSPRV